MRRRGRFASALAVAAVLEYAGDLYPKAPPRTAPGALAARILSGASCGWIVANSRGDTPALGAVLGAAGAVAGAHGGLVVRMRAAAILGAVPAAIVEDVVAIALALAVVDAL